MSTQAHTPTRSSFPVVVAIVGLLLIFWFLTSKVYVDKQAQVPVTIITTTTKQDRPTLAEHRGKAAETLNNFKVLDAAKGKVRLPIERAKELVLKENAN